MNVLAKITVIVLALTVCVVMVGALTVPAINDINTARVETELSDYSLPDKTELISSKSLAGNLSDDGHGMQYLGAILIKSELTLDEISAHYSQYCRDGLVGPTAVKYEGENLHFGRYTLGFGDKTDSDSYYVVYMFESNGSAILNLDMRGY